MNQNTNFAYAAGYIDGDGCIYIGKSGNKFIEEREKIVNQIHILNKKGI